MVPPDSSHTTLISLFSPELECVQCNVPMPKGDLSTPKMKSTISLSRFFSYKTGKTYCSFVPSFEVEKSPLSPCVSLGAAMLGRAEVGRAQRRFR